MNTKQTTLLLTAVSMFCACGTAKSYRLPVSGAEARQSFAPIGACAGQKGYESFEHEDGVHVKIDDEAYIYYKFGLENDFNMSVHLMDDPAPPARFSKVKGIGDQIWSCADPRARATAVGVAVASVPQSTATCERLAQCYRDLASALCAGRTNECGAEFTVTASDDDSCRAAFTQVPEIVDVYRVTVPNFRMPQSCEGASATKVDVDTTGGSLKITR